MQFILVIVSNIIEELHTLHCLSSSSFQYLLFFENVALMHGLHTMTTIVHPDTKKMMRKNKVIRSMALLIITSEAPSWQESSEQSSTSPVIR